MRGLLSPPPLNENAWGELEQGLAANLDENFQKALCDIENESTATRRTENEFRAAGGTYCGTLTVASQFSQAAAAGLCTVSVSWLWWQI